MVIHNETNELKQKCREIVSSILELDDDMNLSLNDDLSSLGLDSMKSVELVIELEEVFNIIFEDEELITDNFSSIKKIVDRIQVKLGCETFG